MKKMKNFEEIFKKVFAKVFSCVNIIKRDTKRCALSLLGLQLRWLERTPDKGEVVGSSPFRPTKHTAVACQNSAFIWGISSAGRAPALHAGGQRFDPAMLHQTTVTSVTVFFCVQALSLLIINNGSLFVVGRYYTSDLTHLRITQLIPGLKPQTSFGRPLARKTCLRAGY